MRIVKFFLPFIIAGYLSSCGSQVKTLNYFEKYPDGVIADSTIIPQTLIQNSDILSVSIYSASLDPKIDEPFNPKSNSSSNSQLGLAGIGLLVDANGIIKMPVIGLVKAEGLTRTQLEKVIEQKIIETGQLQSPTVTVRLLSYKITVLGEVGNQGQIPVPSEKITILEALGLCGDITLYGRKEDVRVIREKNGKQEIGTIDLTSKDIFSSPYFFLNNNDVVLVAANKNKNRINEQIIMQRTSFALGLVTSLLVLYNVVKK